MNTYCYIFQSDHTLLSPVLPLHATQTPLSITQVSTVLKNPAPFILRAHPKAPCVIPLDVSGLKFAISYDRFINAIIRAMMSAI